MPNGDPVRTDFTFMINSLNQMVHETMKMTYYADLQFSLRVNFYNKSSLRVNSYHTSFDKRKTRSPAETFWAKRESSVLFAYA